MAFPTTGLLDAFAGSDEDPIATNWSGPTRTGAAAGVLRLVSNEIARSSTTAGKTNWMSYYDISTFGPDSEVYAVLGTLPGGTGSVSLTARIRDPGAAGVDFYQASYTVGTGWRAFRVTNNVYVQLGSTVGSPAMSAGDSIGLEVTGTGATVTVRVLHKTGGSWSEIISTGDTSVDRITVAGYLGAEFNEATARMDDFSGGTVVVGYSLDCQPGSFGITGADATLAAARLFQADPASFVVTGAAATLAAGLVFSADPDTFTVTGADATLSTVGAFELDCQPAAFTVTGSDATVAAGRTVAVDPGNYAVTGADAGLEVAVPGVFTLDANTGTFVVTGANATTVATRVLTADPTSYAVTGTDATFVTEHSINAATGSYTVTGADANVLADRVLNAAPATYAFVGFDAGVGNVFDYDVDAQPGSFVVAGSATLTFSPSFVTLMTRGGRIRWNTTGRITQNKEGAVT